MKTYRVIVANKDLEIDIEYRVEATTKEEAEGIARMRFLREVTVEAIKEAD